MSNLNQRIETLQGTASEVHIRKNSTGEVRVHRNKFDWCEFQWSGGNYACDCNRHLFFNRAAGVEPDEDMTCGEVEYSIVRVVGEGGQPIEYDESEVRA